MYAIYVKLTILIIVCEIYVILIITTIIVFIYVKLSILTIMCNLCKTNKYNNMVYKTNKNPKTKQNRRLD